MTDLFDQEPTVGTELAPLPRDTSPLSILDQLVARGSSVDELAKLFELQKEHEKWEAKKAFAAAMIECQRAMPDITRTKFNTQTSSWYADIEAVHKAMKPVYQRYGFSCSHTQAKSDKPDHYLWVCRVMHSGGHTEEYSIDLPSDDEGIKGGKCKTAVQGVASSGTYAQRYLECRAFDVTIPWLDRDGNRQRQAGKTVTDDQIATINDWIFQKDVKLGDFLKAFRVESLSDLPQSQYAAAIEMLKKRPAGAKR